MYNKIIHTQKKLSYSAVFFQWFIHTPYILNLF